MRIFRAATKGFTLIELLVIIVVISLIAVMVYPNVFALRTSREAKNFLTNIRALAVQARNEAINRGQTIVMTSDSANHHVTIDVDTTTTNNNIGAQQTQAPLQLENGGASSTALPDFSAVNVTIPGNTTLQTFKLGTNDSNEGAWMLHFYADGRTDGGGFEILQYGQTHSFVVDPNGSNQMLNGNYPDQTQNKWTAGQYEQRQ